MVLSMTLGFYEGIKFDGRMKEVQRTQESPFREA